MGEPTTQFEPSNLLEAIRFFFDPATCVKYLAERRWPDGPTCPKCGGKQHSYLSTRFIWKCRECKKQFSVKVGTIFEDSPLGLDKWLPAVWLLTSSRTGVSSMELHRSIGVTQKTAWFMAHRIRLALQAGSFNKAAGRVEVDETFIGQKARSMHKHMIADRKHKYGDTMKTFKQLVTPTSMSRVVRGSFPDRQFDVDFWQQQGDAAIFEAAWEMVEIAQAFKGTHAELRPDFKDFLRLLNKHQVKYLIVGGYAVMKYTEPFYTKDMDIWIDATPYNAKRTYQALRDFGAPMADLTVHDLTQQHIVFQFGMAPARVDVMTSIDAVMFSEAWAHRVQTNLDDIPISIISVEHLKQNKRSANRDTDKIHLARLEKYSKPSN